MPSCAYPREVDVMPRTSHPIGSEHAGSRVTQHVPNDVDDTIRNNKARDGRLQCCCTPIRTYTGELGHGTGICFGSDGDKVRTAAKRTYSFSTHEGLPHELYAGVTTGQMNRWQEHKCVQTLGICTSVRSRDDQQGFRLRGMRKHFESHIATIAD